MNYLLNGRLLGNRTYHIVEMKGAFFRGQVVECGLHLIGRRNLTLNGRLGHHLSRPDHRAVRL